MTRALIIGAGIVGCASALRLAQRGVDVIVLERSTVGEHGASAAAAGILGAQLEAHPVAHMQSLCVASRKRYPSFVAEITELGGVSVELRRTGAMRLAYGAPALAELREDVRVQRGRGLEAAVLTAEDVRRMEPVLAPVAGAAYYCGDGVVDPVQLLQATRAAAVRAGVRFEEGQDVRALSFDDHADVTGVALRSGHRAADLVVLAAGSWSTRIEGVERVGLPIPTVEPVRGQMIEMVCAQQPLHHVVQGPAAYLSPRADGRLLLGATVERVGFERAVTVGAVSELTAAAVAMVPSLGSARLARTWCGFRAGTPDGLPIFARAGRLVVATGHYRNGIVLAPITADIVTALALDEPLPCDVSSFSIERFKQEVARGHIS